MLFEKYYGEPIQNDFKGKIRYRDAVRAVIFNKGKILMVLTSLGDYKFPGGGVEPGEGFDEALVREIAEETGYVNARVKKKIGLVIQRKPDEYVENTIFQMNSHYYLCELTNFEKAVQKLDDYEKQQQFTPKWVELEDAINQNVHALEQPEHNKWIIRENYVLNKIKQNFK